MKEKRAESIIVMVASRRRAVKGEKQRLSVADFNISERKADKKEGRKNHRRDGLPAEGCEGIGERE